MEKPLTREEIINFLVERFVVDPKIYEDYDDDFLMGEYNYILRTSAYNSHGQATIPETDTIPTEEP